MSTEHCPGCTCLQDPFVARRLDIWVTAQAAMIKAKWPNTESPAVDAVDVQRLADFLSGDNAPPMMTLNFDDDADGDEEGAADEAEEGEPEADG